MTFSFSYKSEKGQSGNLMNSDMHSIETAMFDRR